MAMAENGRSINFEGALGLDARISGGSAFGQLTDALTTSLKEKPEFADVLQRFVDYTHSEKPKLLSEELLGKWVGLAAEHTLLDAKKMPNEADGARWIALDGKVARLEDAILVAHHGKKSVSLDERFIRIIADPSGDTQKRIADSLDDVIRSLSSAPARTAMKVFPVVTAGAMLFSACTPARPTINPDIIQPTITQQTQIIETPSPIVTLITTPAETPTSLHTKVTPTKPTVTEVAPHPTATPEGPHREYTPEQQTLIDSGYFQPEMNKLDDFINNYWCKAANGPFDVPENEAGLHWPGFYVMYLFNHDNTVGHVVFGAAVDKSSYFYFPIVNSKFFETPPQIKPGDNYNSNIPPEYQPLWLPIVMDLAAAEKASTNSIGNTDPKLYSALLNSMLGVDDSGDFVRLKNGQIVANLDLAKNAWVLTYTSH
jgi:hypothetical protein